jgi:hypothetical protein
MTEPRTPSGVGLAAFLRGLLPETKQFDKQICDIEDQAARRAAKFASTLTDDHEQCDTQRHAAEKTASWNADYADRLILQSQAAEADAAALRVMVSRLRSYLRGGESLNATDEQDIDAALAAHDKRLET